MLLGGRRMTKASAEKTVQFKVSPELRKEIHRKALERDETVRTFILKALKTRGITIADRDLVDRRKAAG
jgi:hypothetical protein